MWRSFTALVLATALVSALIAGHRAQTDTAPPRKPPGERCQTDREVPPGGFFIRHTENFPFMINVVHETDTQVMALVSGKFGELSMLPEPENWPIIPLVHDRLAANGFARCKTLNLLFHNWDGVSSQNSFFLSVILDGDDYGEPAHRGSIRSATLSPFLRCTPPACQFRPPGFGPVRVSELAEILRTTTANQKPTLWALPFVLSSVILHQELKTDTCHPHVMLKDFEDNSATVILYLTDMLHVPVTEQHMDGNGQAAIVKASLGIISKGEYYYEGEIVKTCGTRQDYLTLRSENRKNPCLPP
ncbi:hypothetical protein IHV25_07255 [Phaeovibrio sulfidiphilus]|uniref:Uncharacterized protein n=1 Tax=Phaeovibrio sulfidiphilus TaxID=1220600 RepID=A0A8J7CE09_9PROT|nr:hypothetical protein [Phaeovibrio sulfidiphilus]MBE1237444.1 hypothetical protein [Phaeovibrio sulfidiphilus]